MGWIKELEAFWTSEAGINFYNHLAMVGFWIGIPLTLILIWPLLISPGRKLTKRIKQIEKDIHVKPDKLRVRAARYNAILFCKKNSVMGHYTHRILS